MGYDYEFTLEPDAPVPKTGFWSTTPSLGVKFGPFKTPVEARYADYPPCGGDCCANGDNVVRYERAQQTKEVESLD